MGIMCERRNVALHVDESKQEERKKIKPVGDGGI